MQFDGRENYHQVSEWKGKTVASEAEKAQAKRVAAAADGDAEGEAAAADTRQHQQQPDGRRPGGDAEGREGELTGVRFRRYTI